MEITKSLSQQLRELMLNEFPHHSDNIKRFAKSRKFGRNNWRVVREAWNNLNGECDMKDGTLYFAYSTNGFICGAKIQSVRTGNFDTFAYQIKAELRDETEWFMKEYAEKGKCAFGDDHNHVWEEFCEGGEDKRQCKHCHKREVRMVKMVPKVWWENE